MISVHRSKKQPTITVIGLDYVDLPLAVKFGKNLPTLGVDLSLDKVADVAKELQDFGCEVHVYDLLAEAGQALREYGICLRDWYQLPQNADAIIAAVSHAEYTAQPMANLLAQLKPGGMFMGIKSSYEQQAITTAGATL